MCTCFILFFVHLSLSGPCNKVKKTHSHTYVRMSTGVNVYLYLQYSCMCTVKHYTLSVYTTKSRDPSFLRPPNSISTSYGTNICFMINSKKNKSMPNDFSFHFTRSLTLHTHTRSLVWISLTKSEWENHYLNATD